MAKKLLALDSSVVLHWLVNKAPKGQEARWDEAQELFKRASELEQWEFALPTNALAEVLAGVPMNMQAGVGDLLKGWCILLNFDAQAAHIAARFARRAIRSRTKTIGASTKQQVKVDVEIIASAVRHGCGGLCVFDGDHHRIASRIEHQMLVGPPTMFMPAQLDYTKSSKPLAAPTS